MNVRTRVQEFHVEDLAAGRTIDPDAIAMERMATLYVDELFDPTGPHWTRLHRYGGALGERIGLGS